MVNGGGSVPGLTCSQCTGEALCWKVWPGWGLVVTPGCNCQTNRKGLECSSIEAIGL